MTVQTIHKYHDQANEGGEKRSEFVRWATNQILSPRLMDKIPSSDWSDRILEQFQDVAAELQRATTEIDNEIVRKRQLGAEGIRFDALHDLLEKCFSYTEEHLRVHNSRIGVDALGMIANEIDIIDCMKSGNNLRGQYVAMRQTGEARHICFQHTAQLVLKRLKERGHPIPLDNALRNMLKVVPDLDALTLETLCVQDWYMTLVDHGMAAEAEAFDTAMDKNQSESGASTPKGKRSASVQSRTGMPSASELGSTYLLPMRNYTPSRSQQGESTLDDEDGSESSSVTSTVRGSVKDGPVTPVKSTLSTNKVDQWEPWMPAKNSVEWERMQGNLRPSVVEQISKESNPAVPSWMGPNVKAKAASGNRVSSQSSHDLVAHHDARASVLEEGKLAKEHSLSSVVSPHRGKRVALSPNGKVSAGKTTIDDNGMGAQDLDEQATPTKAAGKKSQVSETPLHNSTPQNHHQKQKPTNTATVKQEAEHDDKQNAPTANTVDNMYFIGDMSAEDQRRADSWVNVRREYHSWPRSLIIEHNIELTLANKQRYEFLKELAKAEKAGRPAFANAVSDSVREAICERMWSEIKTIRNAVLTAQVKLAAVQNAAKKAKKAAKKQGLPPPEAADLPSMPTGKTLGEIIGLMEVVDDDGDSVMADKP